MSLFDWFADRRKNAPVVRPSPSPDEAEQLAADIWCDSPSLGPEDAAEREVASWRSLGIRD